MTVTGVVFRGLWGLLERTGVWVVTASVLCLVWSAFGGGVLWEEAVFGLVLLVGAGFGFVSLFWNVHGASIDSAGRGLAREEE